MTKSEFIKYIILQFEGGSKITNHPKDSGGVTKYGIAQNYNPDVDVVNLTMEQAISIYENKYWTAGKCKALYYPLNFLHFDAVINCGRSGSASILQMALKEYGIEVKHDAWFGKNTWKALKNVKDKLRFCFYYQKSRHQYYYNLVSHNRDKYKDFFRGWTNRVWMLTDKILLETGSLWTDVSLKNTVMPEEFPDWMGYI